MGGIHKTVKPLYEVIRAEVSLWDSRKAAQGRGSILFGIGDTKQPGLLSSGVFLFFEREETDSWSIRNAKADDGVSSTET